MLEPQTQAAPAAPEQVTVTSDQVRAFFLKWEQDARAGKCRTPDETAAMLPEAVADTNTFNFLEFCRPAARPQGEPALDDADDEL